MNIHKRKPSYLESTNEPRALHLKFSILSCFSTCNKIYSVIDFKNMKYVLNVYNMEVGVVDFSV